MSETRRAVRPAEHRILAGVSAGLAEHLGVPVVAVRLVFAVTVWFSFAGVIAYFLLWRFLPLATPDQAPGIEAADRSGFRRGSAVTDRELLQSVAVAAIGLGLGLIIQFSGRGVPPTIIIPVSVAVIGVMLIWRQLDDASWSRWSDARSHWRTGARAGTGLVLMLIATIYLITRERGFGALLDLAIAVFAVVVGIALIAGPWLTRLLSDLAAERRERVRTQERADVAAHLHDSVLQTLALLQKSANDPGAVATLARRQERELRDWLYGQRGRVGDSLVSALTEAAADVETGHHIPIELVHVGDTAMDDDIYALVLAAREAMVNASKHAQTTRVDVYSECDPQAVRVYIRDRGVGFDPQAVASDRLGIAGSIMGRMERHGGTAQIISAPGAGTEIRLTLSRDGADQQEVTE